MDNFIIATVTLWTDESPGISPHLKSGLHTDCNGFMATSATDQFSVDCPKRLWYKWMELLFTNSIV